MCVHRRGFVWVALLIWPLFCRPAPGESLDSAWLVALANDQRLKSANALVAAAQSGVASAKAERCPNAGVSVGYSARDKIQAYDSNIPGSTIVPTSQRDSVNSVAFVNQPLYTFGRIRSTIEAARDKTCVAQAEVDQIVQEIKLNVASAYADVLHFRHNVDVAKATVTSLTGHLKDVRNRVGQGVAISNELLATQVKLANAQQQVLAEQNLFENAKGAFNRALGRDLNTPVDLAEMREPAGTPDLDFLSQVALQRRSELVQLHCEAMSYQNQASSIRSSYLPQLNLLGASTYEENRYQVNPQITSLSVNCQWDFFDSGRRSFQAMNLEDQAVAAERERADKQSVISLQVYKSWLDLKSRREQVVVAQSALKASDENVRVTRARYNQGTGTNTEVLDAETLREQAYRNYFASVYSSLVSYMALQRAAGVL